MSTRKSSINTLGKSAALVVFLLVVASASGQNYRPMNLGGFDKKPYHFGFLLGFNSADYYVDRHVNFGFKDSLLNVTAVRQPGFNLGIIASLNFTKNIHLRFTPTLSFEDRALDYTFYVNADSTTFFTKRVESTFIDFPLNFKFRTDRLNNLAAYVVAGGRFRIDMQSEKDVKNAVAEDIIVKAQKHDFAMEFGGGLDFFLPYFKFGVELKMAVGIPNVLVEEDTQFSAPLRSLRSRTFLVTFTFEG